MHSEAILTVKTEQLRQLKILQKMFQVKVLLVSFKIMGCFSTPKHPNQTILGYIYSKRNIKAIELIISLKQGYFESMTCPPGTVVKYTTLS